MLWKINRLSVISLLFPWPFSMVLLDYQRIYPFIFLYIWKIIRNTDLGNNPPFQTSGRIATFFPIGPPQVMNRFFRASSRNSAIQSIGWVMIDDMGCYAYTYTYIQLHTYIHTHIHIHIHIHIHTYVHTYIHTYIHTYTYLPTYIHTFTDVHT